MIGLISYQLSQITKSLCSQFMLSPATYPPAPGSQDGWFPQQVDILVPEYGFSHTWNMWETACHGLDSLQMGGGGELFRFIGLLRPSVYIYSTCTTRPSVCSLYSCTTRPNVFILLQLIPL